MGRQESNQTKYGDSGAVIHLQFWANGSWDSLFPISMRLTANLLVQNTIFNDKFAMLLHPGTFEIKTLHPRDKIIRIRCNCWHFNIMSRINIVLS